MLWAFPKDEDLFEATYFNRGKLITRYSKQIEKDSFGYSKQEIQSYRGKTGFIKGAWLADSVVERVMPNGYIAEDFKNDTNIEWSYYPNRVNLIPLRWSNSLGDYYTPFVKRISKSGKIESLCPYCCDKTFFDDELFLNYQFHLWENHFVSIKNLSEGSPIINDGYHNICFKCQHIYKSTNVLDTNEYLSHINYCKSDQRVSENEEISQATSLKFSSTQTIIFYDQDEYLLQNDKIIQDNNSSLMKDIRLTKKMEKERKKQLVKELYYKSKLRKGIKEV